MATELDVFRKAGSVEAGKGGEVETGTWELKSGEGWMAMSSLWRSSQGLYTCRRQSLGDNFPFVRNGCTQNSDDGMTERLISSTSEFRV
jgi:hypothetical protein